MSNEPMSNEVPFRRIAVDEVHQRQFEDGHIEPYVRVRRVLDDPDVVQVTFPPGARLAQHSHPADTLYIFQQGEFHIEGEGSFHPGDIRCVKGGLAYGPEWAGPEGAVLLIVATNGSFGTDWSG